jgi:WXXGXW repeat (2 copies)
VFNRIEDKEGKMKALPRIALCMAMAAAGFFVVSPHSSSTGAIFGAAVASAQDQAPPDQGPPDQGPDPASVNQAPVQDQPSGQSYTTQAPPPPDQAGAPDQNPDDGNYAEQPTQQADQAPPPLPDYDQPPAPGDDYSWTPGYWAWGPAGYYWVPGVWVEPPYVGALWTPGYWGFYGGRYLFYPGHWGLHIGFYGGINYGFGYIGLGYEGGYWNHGHFFYNRVYNHVDVRTVHNVYNYRANVHVNSLNNVHVDNNVRTNNFNNNVRQSYRGGPSGVQARPQASEGAAWREPYAPRMNTQVQHEQNYSAMRGQYASENHGRPATPAISHALPADRGVQPQSHGSSGGGHHR